MKPDETIDIALQEIQYEIKDEEDTEFSTQELFNIANSQFVGGAVAVNKRLSFYVPYIGTFILKNKRFIVASVANTSNLREHLSEEDFKKLVDAKRTANKRNMQTSRIPLIKDLADLPDDLADSLSIKKTNALYRQIVAEVIEDPTKEIDLNTHSIEKIETEYITVEDEIKDELLNEERDGQGFK